LRVAQLVSGIGTSSAKKVLDAMGEAPDAAAALHAFKPPAAATSEWAAWVETFDALQSPAIRWPADIECATRWYLPQLHRLHDDASIREGDLAQLTRLAAGYASREAFLTELTLDPPDATSDESGPPSRDEDYLILSTIHSAKGQEWKAVFVLNAVDGCIPSDMATGNAIEIEEERRLLYVAMTRARQHLHLLVPQRFYVTQQSEFGDRHLYGSLTRFIPPAISHCFQATGARGMNASTDALGKIPISPTPAPPMIDVAARVRGVWN
jgi:DNA helicase-2/ATP-dependent DNA helicase PcrA